MNQKVICCGLQNGFQFPLYCNLKNSGELIVLAQPLVFIHDLIHLLVEFGGGKYQRYKWLKWHNTVVS